MVALPKPFRCEVITPSGRAFGGEVISIVFPAPDGLVGVLGGRGPLMVMLGSGPMRAREMSGGKSVFFVAGGFARFLDNTLVLLCEDCVPVQNIDPDVAWEEIQKAQAMSEETPRQIEARQEALKRARDKFNMAQKYQKQIGER